ncbi:hypothetical protein TWF718_000215 [Orbilia javanica]|uniref:Uncharacterized protein n=1 Tax=Orbilia javanica TaxID=47235 RepID=A0AAN8NEJ1_9PEZI
MKGDILNTDPTRSSWVHIFLAVAFCILFLYPTPIDGFAYLVRSSNERSKVNSGIIESELCHHRIEPKGGGASITQFGVVNWKQSFQAKAIVFFTSATCVDNTAVVMIRLLNERTGVQYVDMSGPNIPPNIHGYRALNLDKDLGPNVPLSRRHIYEEAARMVPGSMYVPRLPNDPTQSSYCLGSIVVPPWNNRYNLSSDDPTQWDVYKQAMQMLRVTFGEFRRNPPVVKNLLGIEPVELDPLPVDEDPTRDVQRRINQFYNEMDINPEDFPQFGSIGVEECVILAAGQGVPEMKDFLVDPEIAQVPAEIVAGPGDPDSFENADIEPTITKKQKPSAQEPVLDPDFDLRYVNTNSAPYLPAGGLSTEGPGTQPPFQMPKYQQFNPFPSNKYLPVSQSQPQNYFQYPSQHQYLFNPQAQLQYSTQLNLQYPTQHQFQAAWQGQFQDQMGLNTQQQSYPQLVPKSANIQNRGGNSEVKLAEIAEIVSRYSFYRKGAEVRPLGPAPSGRGGREPEAGAQKKPKKVAAPKKPKKVAEQKKPEKAPPAKVVRIWEGQSSQTTGVENDPTGRRGLPMTQNQVENPPSYLSGLDSQELNPLPFDENLVQDDPLIIPSTDGGGGQQQEKLNIDFESLGDLFGQQYKDNPPRRF